VIVGTFWTYHSVISQISGIKVGDLWDQSRAPLKAIDRVVLGRLARDVVKVVQLNGRVVQPVQLDERLAPEPGRSLVNVSPLAHRGLLLVPAERVHAAAVVQGLADEIDEVVKALEGAAVAEFGMRPHELAAARSPRLRCPRAKCPTAEGTGP
jgi:hypothetical protein